MVIRYLESPLRITRTPNEFGGVTINYATIGREQYFAQMGIFLMPEDGGFGLAPIKTEGADIWYDPNGPRPPRQKLSLWSAFWTETHKRLTNAYWALRGDSGT